MFPSQSVRGHYNLRVYTNSHDLALTQINKRRLALENIVVDDLSFVVDLFKEILRKDKTLFLAGNGGSAATAQHFAVDIGVGSLASGNALKAISLVDNAPIITASSNDFGYEQVFSRQLTLLGKTDDLLMLFSASGNSENLLSVNRTALSMGIKSLSFTGFDGGRLKRETTYNLHIPTEVNDYGLVEDIHSCFCHILTDCLRDL